MQLAMARAYDLLSKHAVFEHEVCDRRGQVLGEVRYARLGELGAWGPKRMPVEMASGQQSAEADGRESSDAGRMPHCQD